VVIEVSRKILGIAVVLMAVAMLATPLVSAKPSAEKNNPKFLSFLWHSENGGHVEGMDVVKTNPPGAAPEDVIVTHTYGVWELNDVFDNYVQIGDDDPITIYADHYEGDLYVQAVATSPTSGALNYRVYDKIMWGDGNYIEIKCNERATFDMSGPIPMFYASGTFNGHGVIDGQNVQVMGIREGFVAPVGFVLECTGTIQFLGKA
jgi:hypothetical protein